ncbi:Rhodanese-like domain-containing protein [Aspergillus egyptiacus]|nr:Rhodanese-like domain-containing protein [Aspergillus egyptiacus]
MASLLPIRRRPGGVASFFSSATKLCLASDSKALPILSTRQSRTLCLAPPADFRIARSPRTPFRTIPAQRFASIRWNSEKSSTPTLRQWGFEDINASLPSSAPSSPSSAPEKKRIILVDVREPAEMSSTGVIPSAVAVPLASQPDALFLTPDEFETRFGYPKPGVEEAGDIVFYCKAGVRAKAAAQLAVQAGYEPDRVGVYEGSWLDWAKNGGRVEKWEGDE